MPFPQTWGVGHFELWWKWRGAGRFEKSGFCWLYWRFARWGALWNGSPPLILSARVSTPRMKRRSATATRAVFSHTCSHSSSHALLRDRLGRSPRPRKRSVFRDSNPEASRNGRREVHHQPTKFSNDIIRPPPRLRPPQHSARPGTLVRFLARVRCVAHLSLAVWVGVARFPTG